MSEHASQPTSGAQAEDESASVLRALALGPLAGKPSGAAIARALATRLTRAEVSEVVKHLTLRAKTHACGGCGYSTNSDHKWLRHVSECLHFADLHSWARWMLARASV